MQPVRGSRQRRAQKLRIAFLARSLNYDSAKRQLATVTVRFHECGHEVAVGLFYGGGPMETEISAADCAGDEVL